MSEVMSCPNPNCEGVLSVSSTQDAKSVCSVCHRTWDEAASIETDTRQIPPELHSSIVTERARWAEAQVVAPRMDNPDDLTMLLEWYEQYDALKGRDVRFEDAVELLKSDPELHNKKLRYEPLTFVSWLESYVIEANNRAWPAHEDYDEGESLRALMERARRDRDLWHGFHAAVQHLEHPSPEVARCLRFPTKWLCDGIHEIQGGECDAIDAESKAACTKSNARYAEFEALTTDPDTVALFYTASDYLQEAPISDPLYELALDMLVDVSAPAGTHTQHATS